MSLESRAVSTQVTKHVVIMLSKTCHNQGYYISKGTKGVIILFLFDLILYVPSKLFHLNRDGSTWVEPVLS